MLLGVHCSVSGGLENCFAEAEKLNIDALQIFTRNQRQWKAKPIQPEEMQKFSGAWQNSAIKIGFSHTSYLINLASGNDEIRDKSIGALKAEVERCHLLGLKYCVLHPGAAGEQDQHTAIQRVADGLKEVLSVSPDSEVMILLENTAGQGSSIGGNFENLRDIHDRTGSERIGYCFDTCHAFVAGFDIRTRTGMEDILAKMDNVIGLSYLKAFHLNDSKGKLGSHLDRHEHIGKGELGLEPFRVILQNFPNIPKVLETPKENDMDIVNLSTLRELA